MRLHTLEVTAFGPFADTVTVDFDELSEAGLFLLSGPTGAGKTSVLDAVCFALYGDVPGDRGSARRLRSDHAAPGVAPRVVLETSLAGRRFRLSRSPAWERPKKRGTGTTTEQASVVIAERVDGEWVTLSTRLDETGHLVSGLLGMNLTQFTQVAMLPQGRFQSFLRARSEERHQLLQRLFRTGRFEQVEGWLRERRRSLSRSCEAAHQDVADLVSRVSEATDAHPPADWDPRDLTVPAGDGSVRAWAQRLTDDAVLARTQADVAAEAAAGAEQAARRALDDARSLLERRRRLDAAAAELRTLDAAAADHAADVDRLGRARRAATVAPVHRVARSAAAARARTALAADAALDDAAAALGLLVAGRDDIAAAHASALDAAAQVRAAMPDERRLSTLTARVEELAGRDRTLAARAAALREEAGALPDVVTTLRTDLDTARASAAEVGTLGAAVATLEQRWTAHRQLGELAPQLESARAELETARATLASRREEWLDLREARLEGMAGEIAAALAVGDCCPVCGSEDHPRKAARGADAIDAAVEREAQRVVDDAKSEEHLRAEKVRELTTLRELARERAGEGDEAVLATELDETRSRLAAAQRAAERAHDLATRLERAESRLHELTEQQARLAAEQSALSAELAGCRAEAARVRQCVEQLLVGTEHTDLTTLAAEHERRVRVLAAALRAAEEHDAARAAADDADAALAAAVDDAGFSGIEDALAAVLGDEAIQELAQRVAHHDQRRTAVREVLAEPGSEALAAAPLPDLPVVEAAHAAALGALGTARSHAALWSGRARRLAELTTSLGRALDAWAPLREDLDLTSRLCSFVDGRSPDNHLQMRLSAYVLAYRLSQVVAAANERLAVMSDQRYTLEHTARRGAGETRGGLSLLVRDDWSGESRDPVTLSGGETFVVSLALALGLADVITQEAGGADLDTLFVDEGFGSLDADTLDDVLDVLDSLRDGGRVVGVVSHVSEMRDRIPAQLVVRKTRRGSSLSLSRPASAR
ncbi:AAA family ATPase [Nocardioides sp. dk4132]|uniref:AAA family ATPase n=1 Tax=unclassified Nocardioides TaxID=2615069 RepID=UPI001296F295|nr:MULTISPECIES: SMC family ATPase [unclassified Nocardioides]MQW75225.1 AAA family ATPase [Nocardioides sp. dk4132]QGA07622.1 AAA family ATPase [Nocardioides sp. dk884]